MRSMHSQINVARSWTLRARILTDDEVTEKAVNRRLLNQNISKAKNKVRCILRCIELYTKIRPRRDALKARALMPIYCCIGPGPIKNCCFLKLFFGIADFLTACISVSEAHR